MSCIKDQRLINTCVIATKVIISLSRNYNINTLMYRSTANNFYFMKRAHDVESEFKSGQPAFAR